MAVDHYSPCISYCIFAFSSLSFDHIFLLNVVLYFFPVAMLPPKIAAVYLSCLKGPCLDLPGSIPLLRGVMESGRGEWAPEVEISACDLSL